MRASFLIGAIVVLFTAPAFSDGMINNGLAPPNPDNILDASSNEFSYHIRNVGCPPLWPSGTPFEPCPTPGAPTSVLAQDGLPFPMLTTWDTSQLALVGGSAFLVAAHDSSKISMTGGSALEMSARANSQVDLVGGEITNALSASDDSTLTISGGLIGTVFSANSAHVAMSGGQVTASFVCNHSVEFEQTGGTLGHAALLGFCNAQISGGEILGNTRAEVLARATITGGDLGGPIMTKDYGQIIIVGDDFAVDGFPVPNGALTATSGTLTGTLLSGDPIDTTFSVLDQSRIILRSQVAVPALDPQVQMLLCCVLVVIGGTALTAVRRGQG